ncbi:hypothetical protein RN001_006243 [Aquatica leii]|uniref:FLYWCH-type domain-containing protein n=1 Tax=Aquatica leii TaxID=1421715 RepID=A0AAN7PDF2_9COLE|nr:hypothetical protein RN001_006243 [Aquatica leii]
MDRQIQSKRGVEKFTYNGFIYVFDKCSKGDDSLKFWRCERRGRCNARLHTRDGNVLKETANHAHDSSVGGVEVAIALTNLRKLINNSIVNVPPAAQACLPSTSALRKIVRRKRRQIHAVPANPINMNELILAERYKIYQTQVGVDESFLLADNEEDQRIIIFGRRSWLQHLQVSNTWYADGTFSVTPRPFYQVYVVLAERFGGVHPIFYALLPNKQRNTYHRMFQMIKEAQPNLMPRTINCDFEFLQLLRIIFRKPQSTDVFFICPKI